MPSASDNFTGENCFIITNPSMGAFHLYGDDPDEIKIRDIANATSKQCRFTGHMEEDSWYSVAQHMVDVSHIVEKLGGSKADQFAALLHDAPEAYLSDIAAPFKRELAVYYEKEALIWKRIAAKFGVPEKLPTVVKDADWIALFIEARTFVVPSNPAICEKWVGWDPWGIKAKTFPYIMKQKTYVQAKWSYLDRFEKLQDALTPSSRRD